jgi:translocation and assembly module TamB
VAHHGHRRADARRQRGSGTLQLAGGGLDGTIALAPRGGGQGFDVTLTADNASFGGARRWRSTRRRSTSAARRRRSWTSNGSARGAGSATARCSSAASPAAPR